MEAVTVTPLKEALHADTARMANVPRHRRIPVASDGVIAASDATDPIFGSRTALLFAKTPTSLESAH
jgi:hypothetical protein